MLRIEKKQEKQMKRDQRGGRSSGRMWCAWSQVRMAVQESNVSDAADESRKMMTDNRPLGLAA